MNIRPEVALIAGGAVLAALVYAGKNPASLGENIGSAAVDLVDGAVSGAVFTIGDKMGIPDTREKTTIEQGRAELAAGDYWNASFHLPAGEFISGAWSRLIN